jgi:hypothetical protein
MRRVIIACVGVSSLTGLAACDSDPAGQEPVQLKPGLYELSYTGAVHNPLEQVAPSSLSKEVCVSESDAATFPQSYPRKFFSTIGYSCGGPLSERVGNSIAGKVVCSMTDGVSGNLTTNFTGEVSTDSLDVRAKLQMNVVSDPAGKVPDDLDTSVLDDLELRLALRRVGDCPA